MAKKPKTGRIQLSKEAAEAVTRFREGIPKSTLDVANDGLCDEHSVLHLEGRKTVTLKTLAKISKGMGVEYKTMLALARGEIKSLTYEPDKDGLNYLEVGFTIRGNFNDHTKRQLTELFATIKALVPIIFPHSDPRFTDGSIIITVMLYKEDAARVCQAFIAGDLDMFKLDRVQVTRNLDAETKAFKDRFSKYLKGGSESPTNQTRKKHVKESQD